jgi:hypothetical protein
MAVDDTARRIRDLLAAQPVEVRETRLVGGGLGFMVDGHLCCGVSARGLTVRVGPDGLEPALDEPHVQPLMAGNRRARGFVVVAPAGFREDEALRRWIERGLGAVAAL